MVGALREQPSAWASAASGPAKRPPSLKLSGVTLRMPMRTGPSSETGPRAVCQGPGGSGGSARPTWTAASASGLGHGPGPGEGAQPGSAAGEDGPVVAGQDLEAKGPAEPDQGLEGVLVQAGQVEARGDECRRRRSLARPSVPAVGAERVAHRRGSSGAPAA